MVFCEFLVSKWILIVVFVYSSIVLEHRNYRKLACTVYIYQQLHYNADQVLYMVATSQLLMLILGVFGYKHYIMVFQGSCFMPYKKQDDTLDIVDYI